MTTSIVTALILLPAALAAIQTYDIGLQKMCEYYGGVFTQRENINSITGDTCEATLGDFTESQVTANELCSLRFPFRLLKATHGKKTKCSVEATLFCRAGWYFMYQHCYYVIPLIMAYKDAQAACENAVPGGRIASLANKYILTNWRQVFNRIRSTWVRVTENLHPVAVQGPPPIRGPDEKGEYAIAFSAQHYDFFVRANSLVKLDPTTRLQVICEYDPMMTPAEVRYIGTRYSEIYHPIIPLQDGLLIRSSSYYTSSSDSLEVFKNVLKPLKSVLPERYFFHTIKSDLLEFTKNLSPQERAVMIPNFARTDIRGTMHHGYKRQHEYCDRHFQFKDLNQTLTVLDRSPTCDNQQSVGAVHRGATIDLKAMSDSSGGPFWCKVGVKNVIEFEVPDGYKLYVRANGMAFLHRLVDTTDRLYNTRSELDAACQNPALGGDPRDHLSGFDEVGESTFLIELLKTRHAEKAIMAEPNYLCAYIGASRKPECQHLAGYSSDPNSPCSRERVFEWHNNVAQNGIPTDGWLKDDLSGRLPHGQEDPWHGTHAYTISQICDNSRIHPFKGYVKEKYTPFHYPYICGRYAEVKDLAGP